MADEKDGIPLRVVAWSALGVLAVGAVLLFLYFRSLARAVLSDEPIEVEGFNYLDSAALAAAHAEIEAARARGGEVALDERMVNWIVCGGPSPGERFRLAEPYVRIVFSVWDEHAKGYLNGDLLADVYATPEALAFRILSGKVGKVSISSTEGEWVRGKLERQFAASLAENPHARAAFAGAKSVRVAGGRLVVAF